MFRKILNFFLDSIQALVLALSVFVLAYLFVAQPNQVHGNSMFANFHDKEFLLTEKISYKMHDPRRGEVVVFKAPPSEPCSAEECEYIKRVIGLPGETVMVSQGKYYINGKVLKEDYLPEDIYTNDGSFLSEGKPVIVPPNEYILSGDNRQHSRDSREFGSITKDRFIGRAFICYWPADRVRIIEQGKY